MRVQLQYSRFEPAMARRTDADAISCMYEAYALVPQ